MEQRHLAKGHGSDGTDLELAARTVAPGKTLASLIVIVCRAQPGSCSRLVRDYLVYARRNLEMISGI